MRKPILKEKKMYIHQFENRPLHFRIVCEATAASDGSSNKNITKSNHRMHDEYRELLYHGRGPLCYFNCH